MKLMIASDIHGSYYYCKKMTECFELENADKLLILGDVLYHGPRNDLPKEYEPKKVIELLNSINRKILCVRGNCEAEVDQMVLKFPCLAEYALLNLDGLTVYATHGHIYNENNILPMTEGDILLYGHTHIPYMREKDGFVFMNPGSVSIPKENSHNGYMIYENREFIWKDFEGNIIMKKSF